MYPVQSDKRLEAQVSNAPKREANGVGASLFPESLIIHMQQAPGAPERDRIVIV
jgi:hypothetical protein